MQGKQEVGTRRPLDKYKKGEFEGKEGHVCFFFVVETVAVCVKRRACRNL
jgi:hypothetical protein